MRPEPTNDQDNSHTSSLLCRDRDNATPYYSYDNVTPYYTQLFRKISILVITGLAASKSFVPIEEIFANNLIKAKRPEEIFFCYLLASLGSIPTWAFYNRNVSNYYPPHKREDQEQRNIGDIEEARSQDNFQIDQNDKATNEQDHIYKSEETSLLASRVFGFFYAVSSTAMVYQYSPYTGIIPILFAGGTFLTNYAIGYIKTPTGVRMFNSLLDSFKDVKYKWLSSPEEYRRHRYQETRMGIVKYASKVLGNLIFSGNVQRNDTTHSIALKMKSREGNITTVNVPLDSIDNVITNLLKDDFSNLQETITLYDTHTLSLLIQATLSLIFISMAVAAVNSNFASVLDWTENWTTPLDKKQEEVRLALCYIISALSSIGPLCINLSWTGFGFNNFILRQLGYISLQAVGTNDLESRKKQERNLCVTFFIYTSALGCNLLQSLQGYFYTEKSLSERLNNTMIIYTLAACSVAFMFATKYEATFNLIQKYTQSFLDRLNNCLNSESNDVPSSHYHKLLITSDSENKKEQKVVKFAIEQIAQETLYLHPESREELQASFLKSGTLFNLATDVFAVQKKYREESCNTDDISHNP